jgi:hypothetical protein
MKFNILTEAFVALSLISPTLATPVQQESQALHGNVYLPTHADIMLILSSENVKRACHMDVQWLTNWGEAGLRRYRVKLTTTPRNDDHLRYYSDAVYTIGNQGNRQSFWTDGMFVVDISAGDGPIGHGYVKHIS